MDFTNVDTLLATIGTVITILITVYKGIKPVYTLCKKKYDSVKSFIKDVSDCVQLVNTELKTNHGSSIKDAISRIDNKVMGLESKNKAYLSHIGLPIFELNSSGQLTWINRAGFSLLKKDFTELKDLGWMGLVCPDDRDRVESEIEDSSRQRRAFSIKFNLLFENKYNAVIFEATPLFEKEKFNGYFGVIKIADDDYVEFVMPK
jgi:gas vesicle protein